MKFGAKKIYLIKMDELDGAYSCTECVDGISARPANTTGKLLSLEK
jgi:hypothetical protein